jgi:hypothetical protein
MRVKFVPEQVKQYSKSSYIEEQKRSTVICTNCIQIYIQHILCTFVVRFSHSPFKPQDNTFEPKNYRNLLLQEARGNDDYSGSEGIRENTGACRLNVVQVITGKTETVPKVTTNI